MMKAAVVALVASVSIGGLAVADSIPKPPPKPVELTPWEENKGEEEEFGLETCQQKLEDFINSDTLPADMWPSQGHYETMGFEFKQKLGDDTVYPDSWLVKLPKGWTRMMIDDMNGAYIIDGSGNQRVHVYCGENEELELLAMMLSRYRVEYEYTGDRVEAYVIDAQNDGVVYVPDESFDISEQAEICEDWLNQNFPGHDDPTAFWGHE